MKPKLYLETTIPSYLTAQLSRDLIVAGHQQITQEWWKKRKNDFELYISQFVRDEVMACDVEAATERLYLITDVTQTGDFVKDTDHVAVNDYAALNQVPSNGTHFTLKKRTTVGFIRLVISSVTVYLPARRVESSTATLWQAGGDADMIHLHHIDTLRNIS